MGNRRDEHDDRTRVERADPLVGSVLDQRYRIDFRLAAGGFGAIYHATHVETGVQVALKVLHTELAMNDARVIARFRREGSTLAQLKNPHTVIAYELGEAPDGPLYIVMELLRGESLYEVFRAHGPLAWPRMVSIARMVCSSLGEAHALGIIHRDLKPANIHLEKRDGNPDFVKVLDFGIAKIIREKDHEMSELTQAGQMIGTFDYMAPEQMVSSQPSPCTDIYTLGVVMFEMIAGRRPFADANSPTSMLASLLTQTAPPLSSFAADVPPELDRVVARCLERDPPARYQTTDELDADLERLLVLHDPMPNTLRTPSSELVSDEVTVIAPARASQPARRESTPHVIRREGSEPQKAPRDSTPTVPAGGDGRAKRESVAPHVVRRDPSQPRIEPLASAAPTARPRVDGLQPPGDPGIGRTTLDGGFGAPHPPDRASAPIFAEPRPDRPTPFPAPTHWPTPTPSPFHGPPPTSPPAVAQPPVNPSTWTQQPYPVPPPVYPPPPPARGSSYELASAQEREVLIRRVVWAVAIVLGIVLAIVIMSRM